VVALVLEPILLGLSFKTGITSNTVKIVKTVIIGERLVKTFQYVVFSFSSNPTIRVSATSALGIGYRLNHWIQLLWWANSWHQSVSQQFYQVIRFANDLIQSSPFGSRRRLRMCLFSLMSLFSVSGDLWRLLTKLCICDGDYGPQTSLEGSSE